MAITTATGLVSGKIPGTQNGKAISLPYQGMLFPSDMPLVSRGSVRGAGFVSSKDSPGGAMIMTLDFYQYYLASRLLVLSIAFLQPASIRESKWRP